MPRAEYNIVAEVYSGPGTFPPDTLKGLVLGRLIELPRIPINEEPFDIREFYFTHDLPFLIAGEAVILPNVILIDWTLADVVHFPTLGIAPLNVLFTETVIPRFGLDPYARAHLGRIVI